MEIAEGLRGSPKRISCKYFYDARGSRLFEQICELPEYYLTRSELEIMHEHATRMSDWIGPRVRLVELGSGSSLKTRILLDGLNDPAVYIPIDISRRHLLETSGKLAEEYPTVEVLPLVADYSRPLHLPEASSSYDRTVAYFPGSTVGNLEENEAGLFLGRVRRLVGERGGLLIGMDLVKDPEILKAAYDDAQGLTARFNLNLVERLGRRPDIEIIPSNFAHHIRYNPERERIEMYLRSRCRQTIRIDGQAIDLEKDELIHTENCHKYTRQRAAALAARAGFTVQKTWQDSKGYFSVQYWEALEG